MARATEAEINALIAWFQEREEDGQPNPAWRRVILGYDTMFANACDPNSDVLEFKPEILAATTEIARLRAQNAALLQALTDAHDYFSAGLAATHCFHNFQEFQEAVKICARLDLMKNAIAAASP